MFCGNNDIFMNATKTLLRINIVAAALAAMSSSAYAQESAFSTYIGYIQAALAELMGSLRQLSTSAKIAIVASILLGAFLLYLRARDTAENNIRRARNFHKKALEFHEKGNEEEAQKYYDMASQYREKATSQQ